MQLTTVGQQSQQARAPNRKYRWSRAVVYRIGLYQHHCPLVAISTLRTVFAFNLRDDRCRSSCPLPLYFLFRSCPAYDGKIGHTHSPRALCSPAQMRHTRTSDNLAYYFSVHSTVNALHVYIILQSTFRFPARNGKRKAHQCSTISRALAAATANLTLPVKIRGRLLVHPQGVQHDIVGVGNSGRGRWDDRRGAATALSLIHSLRTSLWITKSVCTLVCICLR